MNRNINKIDGDIIENESFISDEIWNQTIGGVYHQVYSRINTRICEQLTDSILTQSNAYCINKLYE